jgi:hypothetical protein
VLPAIDLPIGRTGISVHYSPRYRLTAEPGSFRVETDRGPFTAALRGQPAATVPAAAPSPLPVHIPFPEFGPTVYLVSELTAEQQAPSLEFTYKRENRW